MKLGLVPINVGVASIDQMTELAQHAEALGFESVWTFEHVITPVDYASKYPYDRSGKTGIEPESNFLDPLIALTTSRLSRPRCAWGQELTFCRR